MSKGSWTGTKHSSLIKGLLEQGLAPEEIYNIVQIAHTLILLKEKGITITDKDIYYIISIIVEFLDSMPYKKISELKDKKKETVIKTIERINNPEKTAERVIPDLVNEILGRLLDNPEKLMGPGNNLDATRNGNNQDNTPDHHETPQQDIMAVLQDIKEELGELGRFYSQYRQSAKAFLDENQQNHI